MNNILAATFVLSLLIGAVRAQETVVSGSVRDVDGRAITGAKVRLAADGLPELVKISDENGSFRFENVPAGYDTILVTAAGFAAFESILRDRPIDISLTPAKLTAEVTVSGSNTKLGDTPASVVIVKGEELETNPSATLDEKLRQVPGFTLFRRSGSRTANPTSQGVSLRGTGASGASRAAVLLDNVPLNDPFGGWIYWGRVPGLSINKVEILRGPASSLYGNSAIGGVISIDARDAADPMLDLETSYGSQRTPIVSLFAAADHKKWHGSLSSEAFATDGSVIVAMDQRGSVDTSAGVRRVSIDPFLEYSFSEGRRAFAGAEYFEERRTNGTPLQTNDTKILSGRLGVDLRSDNFGAFTFRSWFLSEIYHQTFSSVALDRNSELLTRLQTVPSQAGSVSMRWSRDFASRGTIFGGAETRIVRGSSDETAFNGGSPFSLIGAGGREVDLGGYVGGTFDPVPRLTLSGDIRFDHWREYAAYSATRALTGSSFTRTSFPDRTERAASPRVSILVRIHDGISFTGTFSTGFRSATLNELYRSFRVGNVLTLANETLKAERAKNVEAGILVSGFRDRVYLRTVAFCTRITDPISNVTLNATPTLITRQRQNLGRTLACGVEADNVFRFRNDLELSSGYLFVDSRVKSFPANRSLEGLRVPQVAANQFTLRATYSNPKVATVSLHFRAAGAQFEDDNNLLRLGGFTAVGLVASHRFSKKVEVFAAFENIFNTTVEAGRIPVVTLADPRTIRIGLRLHIGKYSGK